MKLEKNDIREWQSQVEGKLSERGLLLESQKVYPVSVTPYFLEEKVYQDLANKCEIFLNAIETIVNAYVRDEEVQKYFPELENYRFLNTQAVPYDRWVHLARFDIVETVTGDFKIMETNCACPGGISLVPSIKKVYSETQAFSAYTKDKQLVPQPIDDETFFVKSMLEVYQEVNGNSPETIAFINSSFHSINTDIPHLIKSAKKMGYKAFHAYAEDIEYKSGRASYKGINVDLAHHKFDAHIDDKGQDRPCLFKEKIDEVRAYLDATKDNALVYLNPFPSMKVAENKRILALLHDSPLRCLLSDEQKKVVDELCPTTYFLTNSSQKDIRRINYVKMCKDHYVIKRVLDTRSRGVVIGQECSQEHWNNTVEEAINFPCIVQEYLRHITSLVYPPYGAQPVKMQSNVALFLVKGKAAGLLCRAAPGLKTNVYAAGLLRPVYMYRGK